MMKPIVRFGFLVLALLLAASPALAACSTASASCSLSAGRTCTASANSACASGSCTSGSTCTAGASCSGSSCTATKKPAATKAPTATKAPASGTSMSAMASAVVAQTNAERTKKGLPALSVSSELTRAACVRAKEIVAKFSHTRPDGRAWSTVSSSTRGENIAKGQQRADKVMAAWMSSSGHRANILRTSFGSIGVCAYKVGNTMYWVQEFGK